MRARAVVSLAVFTAIAVLALAPSAAADSFGVKVNGYNWQYSTNTITLSNSVQNNNVPGTIQGPGQESDDMAATAGPGYLQVSASTTLNMPYGSYGSYNSDAAASATFQESFLISGLNGAVGDPNHSFQISFNYFINGSMSVGGIPGLGGNASADASWNQGSFFGGYTGSLGSATLTGAGYSGTGAFSGTGAPSGSIFTAPAILTFAGDTALSFGMTMNVDANAGFAFGSPVGVATATSDFGHTLSLNPFGDVVNGLPDGYTINSTDGCVVNNRWVCNPEAPASVPEPSTLLLLAGGALPLAGSLKRRLLRR